MLSKIYKVKNALKRDESEVSKKISYKRKKTNNQEINNYTFSIECYKKKPDQSYKNIPAIYKMLRTKHLKLQ